MSHLTSFEVVLVIASIAAFMYGFCGFIKLIMK